MPNLLRLSIVLGFAVAVPTAARAASYDFVSLGVASGAGEGGGINRHGDVAAGGFVGGAEHVLVWSHDQYAGAGTDLGSGGAQAIAAGPQAINDAGQVAGFIETADFQRRAAVWIDGTLTDLGGFGGRFAMANSINDHGLVVGQYEDAAGQHAFTWQDGTTQTLPGLDAGDSTLAFDVNNRGVIVGTSAPPNALPRPVVWIDGQAQALGIIGKGNQPFAINNHGQAVGNGFPVGGGASFPIAWGPTGPVALPTLAGRGTAYDVNDAGLIVGQSDADPTGPGHEHAVLWQSGTLIDLNGYAPAGWQLMTAVSINRRGVIFGWAEHAGAFVPFVLVPRCDS